MSTTAESPSQARPPAISLSQHDKVTSGLFAASLLLATTAFLLVMIWFANRLPAPKPPPAVQLLEEDPGGDPNGFVDGTPGETLALGSPDVDPNAPVMAEAEAVPDTAEVSAESLDSVADVADSTEMESSDSSDGPVVNRTFAMASVVPARPGSPFGSVGGTGRPPIGFGKGKGGFPREMRWFVKFVERGTLDEYAQQLEFFGIELGALLPDGRLALVSKLTAGKPTVRYVTNGQEEKRLYFTWKGGTRKALDLQLFQKAGVDASNAVMIMHLYPPETENQLAVLEKQYKNRDAKDIKKTYFAVRSAKQGFEFTITSQTSIK